MASLASVVLSNLSRSSRIACEGNPALEQHGGVLTRILHRVQSLDSSLNVKNVQKATDSEFFEVVAPSAW